MSDRRDQMLERAAREEQGEQERAISNSRVEGHKDFNSALRGFNYMEGLPLTNFLYDSVMGTSMALGFTSAMGKGSREISQCHVEHLPGWLQERLKNQEYLLNKVIKLEVVEAGSDVKKIVYYSLDQDELARAVIKPKEPVPIDEIKMPKIV